MTTYNGLPKPVGTPELQVALPAKSSPTTGAAPAIFTDHVALVPPPAKTVAKELEYLIEYEVHAIDYLYNL